MSLWLLGHFCHQLSPPRSSDAAASISVFSKCPPWKLQLNESYQITISWIQFEWPLTKFALNHKNSLPVLSPIRGTRTLVCKQKPKNGPHQVYLHNSSTVIVAIHLGFRSNWGMNDFPVWICTADSPLEIHEIYESVNEGRVWLIGYHACMIMCLDASGCCNLSIVASRRMVWIFPLGSSLSKYEKSNPLRHRPWV